MPDLFLLRHGKAEPDSESGRDVDRPLSEKGKNSSHALGEFFKVQEFYPEVVLCSESRRTKETYEAISKENWRPGEVQFLPELYHASAQRIFDVFSQATFRLNLDGQSVMIVGHNPGLSDAAMYWMGEEARLEFRGMKVGTLVHFHFPGQCWPDILADPPQFFRSLEFRNYWTPNRIFEILDKS